ncbi:MAG TPA: hypothetical protein PLO47_02285 [Bacillota bacterium]|nr:hypothetical protein [Bacillota bacterium]
MNNRTTGMLYAVAGVCFAVSGAARLVAGKLPSALLQAGLAVAMMTLAFRSFKTHSVQKQNAQDGETIEEISCAQKPADSEPESEIEYEPQGGSE